MDIAADRSPHADSANELERALLQRVADGDREAFRELYVRYHRRLGRFLARLSLGREDAEEVINDTLWVVWQRAADFRAASRVSTWVMGIAYRRALNVIRRAAVHARAMTRELVDEEADPTPGPDAAVDRRMLDRALAQLPLEQRLVLEFAYYLDHSCEEIAVILECPINTVKTRMFHARRKLRALLGESAAPGAGGHREP